MEKLNGFRKTDTQLIGQSRQHKQHAEEHCAVADSPCRNIDAERRLRAEYPGEEQVYQFTEQNSAEQTYDKRRDGNHRPFDD